MPENQCQEGRTVTNTDLSGQVVIRRPRSEFRLRISQDVDGHKKPFVICSRSFEIADVSLEFISAPSKAMVHKPLIGADSGGRLINVSDQEKANVASPRATSPEPISQRLCEKELGLKRRKE
jgi:hypothetical protein